MIRVTVEVIPGGDESKKRLHCIAEISNEGKESVATSGEYGLYRAEFYQNEFFNPLKVWRRSSAFHIHRKRRGAWDILFCCLYNAGLYERNKLILSKRRD